MYPIRGGAVWFAEPTTLGATPAEGRGAAASASLSPVWAAPPMADERLLTRAAALLDLSEPGGVVILGGAAGALGPALEEMTGVTFLLLDPTQDIALGAGVSALRAGGAVPLAPGSLRAALMDRATATPSTLEGVSRALRRGGRLVAPADLALPAGVDELARDSEEWVAARQGTSTPPITLRRNR